MKKSGLNLVGVKEFNRSLILQNICTGRSMTRHKLARSAQLSTMTVTNLTSELLSMGIIAETDSPDDHKGVGRSPKILLLSPHSPVVLGVWLSKDSLYGTVSDLALQTLFTKKVPFQQQETEASILEKLGALTAELAASTDRKILGMGLASVGVIDAQEGGIRYVTDLFGIQAMKLRPYLQPRFDFPIFVGNDMHASGLAELYFGHGQLVDDFLYVGISNGLGSAVIANHQLVNSSGELGHLSIDYNGPKCTCGSRGCLELYASATSILGQINEACNTRFTTFAEAMEFCGVSNQAYSVLYGCAGQLTYALNSFVNIIDVATIVVGHDGCHMPDDILSSMERTLNRISVLKDSKRFRIFRSTFDDRAPLYGAVCLVLEQLFSGVLSL